MRATSVSTPLRSPLTTVEQLQTALGRDDVRLVDCRFSLADSTEGYRRYTEAHIPGAVYAHLNDDLSGPVEPGRSGRHPLPDFPALARKLGAWGISNTSQVVTYDQNDGSMAAARLWWLLRYMGHEKVTVLSGGLDAWRAGGGPAHAGAEPAPPPRIFSFALRPELVASRPEIAAIAKGAPGLLLDARALPRFTGEVEPIDTRAGHIPRARSLPFGTFVQNGHIVDARAALARLPSALQHAAPPQAIAYCGSGVTACHLLLTLAHAGVESVRLYPGSWSEWIVDPDAEIETGPERK